MWLPAPGRRLALGGCCRTRGRGALDAPPEGLLSGAGSARGERSEVALGEAAVLAVLLEHHTQTLPDRVRLLTPDRHRCGGARLGEPGISHFLEGPADPRPPVREGGPRLPGGGARLGGQADRPPPLPTPVGRKP